MTTKNTNIHEWENAAKAWLSTVEENIARNHILIPKTMEILGDVSEKNVLDLGCGEGGYSRLLAKKGAKVIGVDASNTLISAAKELSMNMDIAYYVKSACDLKGIEDNTFDIVISAMCLMAIEDFENALTEIYRVLKPGGTVVISILHPCFSGQNTGWIYDNELSEFIVDSYHDECSYQEGLSKQLDKPVSFWHRTLSNTINPMLCLGFKLSGLYEPKPGSHLVSEFPRLNHLLRVPMFMIIELSK